MSNDKDWLQKEVPLEKWFHKHLLFRDDKELALFIVWAIFTVALMSGLA
jgi:hypothetical protein